MTEGKKPVCYTPDDFRWPECPVSALHQAAKDGWDPVEVVTFLGEARAAGGRGAVWALCRRNARLWDAAVVLEGCRVAEHNARLTAERAE